MGLSFLSLALLARLHVVEHYLITNAPPATYELVKHVSFTVGAISVFAWVRTALTGRRTNYLVLIGVAAAAVTVMVGLFLANGPWTNDDLMNQVIGRPWMAAYWLIYCGSGGFAAGAFGLSALRSSRVLGLRYGWGMAIAAAGGAAGVVWAVTSLIGVASVHPRARESILGMTASALTTVATALLCIGAIGHLFLAIARKRRRQEDLRELHQHLRSTVAETSLESPRSELAQFHASIEIMDALAVLSRFSDVDDVGRVRAVIGDAPREVHLAYQIDIAAARRGIDHLPANSDDWSTWLTDDDALRRLGRAFRDQTTSESRQRLAKRVIGE
ncbi:hypothetical protein [Myceligenerans halotolerans]